MLSEIRKKKKGFHLQVEYKNRINGRTDLKKQKQTHRYRIQTDGRRGGRTEAGKTGEGQREVWASGHATTTSQGRLGRWSKGCTSAGRRQTAAPLGSEEGRLAESPCYTPETNVTVCVNRASITEKKTEQTFDRSIKKKK